MAWALSCDSLVEWVPGPSCESRTGQVKDVAMRFLPSAISDGISAGKESCTFPTSQL